jgi:hypothetical protein
MADVTPTEIDQILTLAKDRITPGLLDVGLEHVARGLQRRTGTNKKGNPKEVLPEEHEALERFELLNTEGLPVLYKGKIGSVRNFNFMVYLARALDRYIEYINTEGELERINREIAHQVSEPQTNEQNEAAIEANIALTKLFINTFERHDIVDEDGQPLDKAAQIDLLREKLLAHLSNRQLYKAPYVAKDMMRGAMSAFSAYLVLKEEHTQGPEETFVQISEVKDDQEGVDFWVTQETGKEQHPIFAVQVKTNSKNGLTYRLFDEQNLDQLHNARSFDPATFGRLEHCAKRNKIGRKKIGWQWIEVHPDYYQCII